MSLLSAGAEKVREAMDQAEELDLATLTNDTWPIPDFGLLGADSAPAPTLSADVLPAVIFSWSTEMAAAAAAPVDYVVANLLVSASGWLGNSRRIGPTPSWIEPPHLWFACIGAPSTGKTPAVRAFIAASHRIEADNEPAWKESKTAHEQDAERAKVRADVWRAECREAFKEGKPAPDMPPDAAKPETPIPPRVQIADATVQEIGTILSGNPKGLLQIRDELSGWLGSMDQFSGAGSDRAFYLESWNGGAHTIDRVKHTGEPVRVQYCSLAIAGGMQPDKLKDALGGADDGLAARFAYVWPDPLPYRDLNIEQKETAAQRLQVLDRAAHRLSELTLDVDTYGISTPVIVPIDAFGITLLNDIRRDSTGRARAAHGLAAGWYGKTPGRVLRLALVIEFLGWAMSDQTDAMPAIVTADSMACACAYVDYLGEMFERVLAGLQADRAKSDAAMIGRLLVNEKPGKINERELYQRAGFSFLRDKERRRKTFEVLAGAGFIRPATVANKGRPPGDWEVNPRVKDHRA